MSRRAVFVRRNWLARQDSNLEPPDPESGPAPRLGGFAECTGPPLRPPKRSLSCRLRGTNWGTQTVHRRHPQGLDGGCLQRLHAGLERPVVAVAAESVVLGHVTALGDLD